MGICERIKEIELEMARTQKNKATERHMGGLKARLAKLRTELLTPKASYSFPLHFLPIRCRPSSRPLFSQRHWRRV
jgi:hypothetical protein